MQVNWWRTIAMCASAGLAAQAGAQELEPRLYANAPPGINFIVAGYAHSEGSVLPDPTVELENAKLEVDGPVFGYARSLSFGNDSGQFAAALGRVCLDGSAEFNGQLFERHACGLTDARVRVAWNFLGAPALGLREFAGYRQDFLMGAGLSVSMPIGDYDPSRLANIGTNRWAVKAELGMSKAIERWIFEVSGAAAFFETNDDYFGGKVRKQDPMYAVQAHVIYGFRSGIWLAANTTWYWGGRTKVDGVAMQDLQSNTRAGMTVSFPVNRRHSIKLAASTGVSARTGTDFDTLSAAWQYRFGAGL